MGLRLPVLLLLSMYPGAFEGIARHTLLFWCLGVLAGSDQLFVFYNFMGAAVGGISKIAVRMGTCTGLLFATTGYGTLAIGYAKKTDRNYGIMPIILLGLLFDAFLVILYVCAPAPYR